MQSVLTNFFASGSFIPHGHCYLWKPGLVSLHLVSDALIAFAYYSIPLTLFYFVRKRQDLPFPWIFFLFALFIIACGTTHLLSIWTLWHPTYWLSGAIKAVTAFVSVLTAIELVPLVPKALSLPSPAQLEQANQQLQIQIQERLRIEEALRQSQNQLEQRVQERTAELSSINQQLQQEIADRHQAEAALKRSEAKFRRLFDANVIGVITASTQGGIVDANDAFLSMTGYSREELRAGQVRWDVMTPPEWQTRDEIALKELATRGASSPYEKEYLHKQGYRIPVVIGAAMLEDRAEDEENAISFILDLSDRHRTEQELRSREQRFSALFNGMEDWVLVYHLDDDYQPGPLIEVNEQACKRLGYSRQELLSLTIADIVGASGVDPVANIQTLLLEKRVVVESVHCTRSGEPIPVEVSATLFTLNGLLTVQAICRDITERKQTEAEIAALNRDLQNRVDELQTLFEVIPIGILITEDSEFKKIRSNPAFAEILGVQDNASCTPPEDTPPPSYKILSNGRVLAPEETPIRHAALNGVSVEGVEIDILRGDGTLFNLYGYAAPLFDEQGKPRGSVGAFLDITDRKQSEAEREELLRREKLAREQAVREAARSADANRIKDEFLAVLSHELRTPLNPILGWTRLLRTGKLDESKTTLALETIERNAKLQTQLIEDLLDISRILQGKLALSIATVDLVKTIEAAQETVRLAAEAKSIHLSFHIDPAFTENSAASDTADALNPEVLVIGDFNRLQQVVWNLLSNAVKFTPAGGQVAVELSCVAAQAAVKDAKAESPDPPMAKSAQITVTDTGKGIAPDFLPHVFDYFRQEDSTTTRRFGGLGLGLAIVRQIVELHGGIVWAESAGEGQGATFSVRLPLIKEENAAESDRGNREAGLLSAYPLTNLRILLVDDEADTRDLLTFVLEQAGALVIPSGSAQAALENFEQCQPDLILSDIGMPEMDGYRFVQQIRAWESARSRSTSHSSSAHRQNSVPAIALTAYAGEYNQQQALAAGFQLHLAKPIDPETLIRAISTLIQV